MSFAKRMELYFPIHYYYVSFDFLSDEDFCPICICGQGFGPDKCAKSLIPRKLSQIIPKYRDFIVNVSVYVLQAMRESKTEGVNIDRGLL